MPVATTRKERPLIELLLTEYENSAWKGCTLDWLEDKQDAAVEVLATRNDKTTLAIEHTLIQPFVGEKFDSNQFITAFSMIEKNADLTVAGRGLSVIIPVAALSALPKGILWESVGEQVLLWLKG